MEYQITENRHISQNYFRLTLDLSEGEKVPIPGQFYNIRCSETKDPLFRRPFSLHRLSGSGNSQQVEFLYRVIGKGTEWLSNRQKNQLLDMIGPLGNGFILDDHFQNIVLVARGIGIAPLYAVGEAFRMNYKEARIHTLIGARLKERIFYEEECRKIGEVFLYTDSGEKGFHGKGPELLAHLIMTKQLPRNFYVYACGPDVMLKELSDLSEEFAFQGQAAMETHMACGSGFCLSCTCPLRPGKIKRNDHWKKPALQFSEDGNLAYSLVCKDGPVYDLQEVDWNEWLA